MPLTPFHLGPGVLLKALAPQRVSLGAFAAANVLIDAEVIANAWLGRQRLHAELHTLGGALLAGVAAAGFVWWLGRAAHRRVTLSAALVGGTLGGVGQTALDSVMHVDIRPLWPLWESNPLLRVVPLDGLHLACALAGAAGLVGLGWRWLKADREASTDRPTPNT